MSCDHQWIDISTLAQSQEMCGKCRAKRAKPGFEHETRLPPPNFDDSDERRGVVFWLFLVVATLAGFVGFVIGCSVGISC